MSTVDVGSVFDEGRWTGYQKLLIAGTALIVVLDGVDNQLLPNALPALIAEWKLPRSAFSTVLAAAPFGMMLGGLLGGLLGDRLGRRTALLGSATVFGVITLLIGHASSVFMLALLRFVAGVGLGGAMPNAAALAAEYVPRRNRPFAVTLTVVSIPLGGFLAGQLAAAIIPTSGWRLLFTVGGVVPLVLAVALFKILPESPRYLAAHPARWAELRLVLRRVGREVGPDVGFVDGTSSSSTSQSQGSRASIRDIFTRGFARDTLGLFGAFFFCLLANYVGFQLIPTMMTGSGFSAADGARANSFFNFGGVGGAVVGAFLIQRIGSRTAMLAMACLGVTSAVAMGVVPPHPSAATTAMVLFAITGGLLNAVQAALYSLGAHVYPMEIRGTGVGTAVAVGRVGNVLAAYVGNFALDVGGPRAYFGTWAISMMFVFGSLALIRRHISPSSPLSASSR